ncbi:MAG: hypothetical protein M1140_09005 [Chloroflexi bacterium]|nr:hypothetical protein [Chloroflexota bacterium]
MFTRRNGDELISAYLDGQLDERSRQAFEARINRDPALRRRVDATRARVPAARKLPAVSVPRNFILSSNASPARQPARAPAGARMWWRFGSALAAAIFVAAIGLDMLGGLQVTQPMMSAAPKPAPTMAAQVASKVEKATAAPALADRAGGQSPAATAPAATAAVTPRVQIQSAMATTPTEEAAAAAAAPAPQAAAQTPTAAAELSTVATSTPDAETPAPKVFSLRAAPEPTETPTAEPAPPTAMRPVEQPAQAPWWRIVAGLALLVAVGAGIMGWLRR